MKKTAIQHPVSAQKFADETGVNQDLATRILSKLYAKGLDANYLSSAIWRLRDLLESTVVIDLMNKADDAMLDKIITEVSVQSEYYNCAEKDATTAWFFAEFKGGKFKEYKEGQKVDIQIFRTGTWQHPNYGEIKIDEAMLDEIQKNFNDNFRKIDIAVDENHEPNHAALGWYKKLYKKGTDALFATIELTALGAEKLAKGAYKYFSPEFTVRTTDEETGSVAQNLLIGGAFTNRPFFKAMQGLAAGEDAASRPQSGKAKGLESSGSMLLFSSDNKTTMFKILKMLSELADKSSITASEFAELDRAFEEIPTEQRTPELQAARDEMEGKVAGGGTAKEAGKDEGGEGAGTATGAGEGGEGGEKKDDTAVETPEQKKEREEAEKAALEGKDDAGEGAAKDDAAGGEGAGTVKATEPVTITASEFDKFKDDQRKLQAMIIEARRQKFTGEIQGLSFSESDGKKKIAILPKDQKEVIDFAMTLSEKQATRFLAIMKGITALAFGEIGSDDAAAATGENSLKFKEAVATYKEKFNMSEEDAKRSARDFCGIAAVEEK